MNIQEIIESFDEKYKNMFTAKQELEGYYHIELDTAEKIISLYLLKDTLFSRFLSLNSLDEFRIPMLKQSQVLDECIEIFKHYYAVEMSRKEK